MFDSRTEVSFEEDTSCGDRILMATDFITGVEYWRERWLFHDWKSSMRYYLMIFFWLVLIMGVSGIIGYYTEPMPFYWLPLSITLIVSSVLYIVWYFYVDWRLAPDLCCVC